RHPRASAVPPVSRSAPNPRDAQRAPAPHPPGGALRIPGAGRHDHLRRHPGLFVRLPDALALLAPREDPGPPERARPGRRRCRPPLATHRRRGEGGEEHLFGLALPLDPRPHDADGFPVPVAETWGSPHRLSRLLRPPAVRLLPPRIHPVLEVRPPHLPLAR